MSIYHESNLFTFNHLTFDIELFCILLSGLVLKLLSMAYKKDDEDPNKSINFRDIYWFNSAKYRSLGSLLVILQIAFLSTETMINDWMSYKIFGYQFGYFTIAGLGYISDNIFILLHQLGCTLVSRLEDFISNKLR